MRRKQQEPESRVRELPKLLIALVF